jgi:diguanylate cyclase (GGDEF)-like protein
VLNNFTLLYIEDDIDAQNYIQLIFEDDLKEIYTASDAIEGLAIYKEKRPDIVLTDINMPKMDGFSVIKEIRKLDKDQPIVVISAFDDKDNLLKAINMSSNGFVAKPIDIDFLYEKLTSIAQHLQEKKDLQERKAQEMQNLYKLAHYDALTEIPNKFLFEITLEKAISKAKRDSGRLTLFFIDLDNFKGVNDTYGHKAGDVVLQSVTRNIKKVIRAEDTLARRSGDEFLLLIEGVNDKTILDKLAKKILEEASSSVEYMNKMIKITLSIGISRFPFDSDTKEDLIHFADIAMYKAKYSGKNSYVFFTKNLKR